MERHAARADVGMSWHDSSWRLRATCGHDWWTPRGTGGLDRGSARTARGRTHAIGADGSRQPSDTAARASRATRAEMRRGHSLAIVWASSAPMPWDFWACPPGSVELLVGACCARASVCRLGSPRARRSPAATNDLARCSTAVSLSACAARCLADVVCGGATSPSDGASRVAIRSHMMMSSVCALRRRRQPLAAPVRPAMQSVAQRSVP